MACHIRAASQPAQAASAAACVLVQALEDLHQPSLRDLFALVGL
jgi:hypothetical protein